MTKNKTYKSDAFAAIHETASDLYAAGVINKQTMREFDEGCLTQVHDFTAEEIITLREREQVSQAVLAHYLNVSKDSVSQEEIDELEWNNIVSRPSAQRGLSRLAADIRRQIAAGEIEEGGFAVE